MGRLNVTNMNFKQHSLSLHSPIAAMADFGEYIADRDVNLKNQSLCSFFNSIDTYMCTKFICYSCDWLAHKSIPSTLHTSLVPSHLLLTAGFV